MSQFVVTWHDSFREPQCASNPKYPAGIDVDGAKGSPRACKADLPYPAKRCGIYDVVCTTCGIRVVLTTAGRPDDPRSVTVRCARDLRIPAS